MVWQTLKCHAITYNNFIESIDLAVDYIIKGNPDIKLGRENLTKLFFFATAQTHFSFLGNFYDQIDGVAMGSPLAPVLANLFMGHHEKRWLENYNSGIEFYRRYVDDTFALFNTEQDALSFLIVILTASILTSSLLWRRKKTTSFPS